MPVIDFTCENGHDYECFRHPSAVREQEPCEECGATATRVYRMTRTHGYTGLTQPLVVWKRPDGTFAVPGQPDARMPAEYERVELRSATEARRVEGAINREEREKWEAANRGRERLREEVSSANRAELRDKMAHMRAQNRDFARFSIDKNNNAPKRKYRGEFHFEALSMNASNRDPGRRSDGTMLRK
jgi:hypothetical protein